MRAACALRARRASDARRESAPHRPAVRHSSARFAQGGLARRRRSRRGGPRSARRAADGRGRGACRVDPASRASTTASGCPRAPRRARRAVIRRIAVARGRRARLGRRDRRARRDGGASARDRSGALAGLALRARSRRHRRAAAARRRPTRPPSSRATAKVAAIAAASIVAKVDARRAHALARRRASRVRLRDQQGLRHRRAPRGDHAARAVVRYTGAPSPWAAAPCRCSEQPASRRLAPPRVRTRARFWQAPPAHARFSEVVVMTEKSKRLGERGEDAAAAYLERSA